MIFYTCNIKKSGQGFMFFSAPHERHLAVGFFIFSDTICSIRYQRASLHLATINIITIVTLQYKNTFNCSQLIPLQEQKRIIIY
jgi:hypothetical protein